MYTKIRIKEHYIGLRLDRFIREEYPGVVQSLVEKLIRTRKVSVNGNKASANQRLIDGDEVYIEENIHITLKELNSKKAVKDFKHAKILSEEIVTTYKIYEDPNILVINKPAGLSVQGGSGIKLSIDDALSYLNNKCISEYKIAHRLDKDTSGILLIAKGRIAAQKIGQHFQDQLIKKTYISVLYKGEGSKELEESGRVEIPICKNNSKNNQKVSINNIDGKISISNYKILKKEGNLALVEWSPLTGRMHQIRVHAAFIGHPILGDYKYGYRSAEGSPLHLHSYQTILPSTLFGKVIKLTAPLPAHIKQTLSKHGIKFKDI